MKVSTKSFATHRHNVTSEVKRNDGGRALILELLDDIHSDKRVGKMTAQFGPGGSLSSLLFEETENIRQSEIEVQAPPPVVRYLT